MSIVTLVSGGLDSTLVALLAKEAGNVQYPLFIDYGQRAKQKEFEACQRAMMLLDLPPPHIAELSGYGRLIRSGLTDRSLRVLEDAYTPGRNMLFLLTAAAYAERVGAGAVAIGLLHDESCIFEDQRSEFLTAAMELLRMAVGRRLDVIAPLKEFYKKDVVELAKQKRVTGTYSCHLGEDVPCGRCIACLEYRFGD
ncbi:7-cyano-7-deazaguanine synthase [Bradyrhizobium septentrionale]|uniref:7-cyano-7-deazaguanine synthase n=1 Tax=Bradyrhizobium septentrionale TaxID=1404411 RepID=UPI0015969538|nr:7-cyano-7-deazaguanine synthase [Bradyrhizobium septentrionale]UGY26658.1 7-cyano-7-deazaguanine synthase [Bradyrhizobium septentrionale]